LKVRVRAERSHEYGFERRAVLRIAGIFAAATPTFEYDCVRFHADSRIELLTIQLDAEVL
jgi:hypothetical protein